MLFVRLRDLFQRVMVWGSPLGYGGGITLGSFLSYLNKIK